jgi:hypothetical protein
LYSTGKISVETVDDTQLRSALQMNRVTTGTDNLPDMPCITQGARQRTTDQAYTNNT